MSESPASPKMNLFKALLILQAALILTVVLNVPYARQILGFVYLTFVPGYIIQRIIGMRLARVESVLVSVGLSVAFLMGEGFLLNSVGPVVGVTQPLDLNLILAFTSIFVCSALVLKRHDFSTGLNVNVDFLNRTGYVLLAFLAAILALSIVGGLTASLYSNTYSYLIFIMLGTIAALIGFIAVFRKQVPHKLYPIILFAVAAALLFHVSLFSQYIVGGDIFGEYALFNGTISKLYWSESFQNSYNALLSVTILPTIYSLVMGLNGTWLFKIVYPALFAFVPVGLYLLFKHKMSSEVAFFSAIFFVSNLAFFTELLQLGRQMVAELFYVLLFVVLFSGKLKDSSKWLLFSIFSFALIVSHYALAYIFLASLAIVWLISYLQKREVKAVTGNMVVLFGVLTFVWFMYTSSGAAFNNLMMSLDGVRTHLLLDFFNPASRGTQVLEAVGASGVTTIWHTLGRLQFYIVEGLVLIGFLAVVIKKRKAFLNDDFKIFMFCNLLILIACVALPNFASIFNVTRFYHVALFLLAPLCVLGGLATLKFITRNRFKKGTFMALIALLILVPFFLFQTGFVYEAAKDTSTSLPLSGYRFDAVQLAQMGVLTSQEVSGADWLAKFQNADNSVFADVNSYDTFAYLDITNGVQLTPWVNATQGSYMYLNNYNVENGIIYFGLGASGSSFSLNQINPKLDDINTVYSNGGCNIYSVP
jgi:uncharacterized membrane protein